MSKPAMVFSDPAAGLFVFGRKRSKDDDATRDYFLLYLKDASIVSAVVVGTVIVRTSAPSKQSERPILAR